MRLKLKRSIKQKDTWEGCVTTYQFAGVLNAHMTHICIQGATTKHDSPTWRLLTYLGVFPKSYKFAIILKYYGWSTVNIYVYIYIRIYIYIRMYIYILHVYNTNRLYSTPVGWRVHHILIPSSISRPLHDLQVHSSAFLANLLALVDPSLESWGKACIKSIATRGVSKSRISLSNIY